MKSTKPFVLVIYRCCLNNQTGTRHWITVLRDINFVVRFFTFRRCTRMSYLAGRCLNEPFAVGVVLVSALSVTRWLDSSWRRRQLQGFLSTWIWVHNNTLTWLHINGVILLLQCGNLQLLRAAWASESALPCGLRWSTSVDVASKSWNGLRQASDMAKQCMSAFCNTIIPVMGKRPVSEAKSSINHICMYSLLLLSKPQ